MAQQARVTFRVDAGGLIDFRRRLELWASDQLPFAIAAALTDTAKDAREAVRERLGVHFKLRNRGLRNAITHLSASKRDNPPTAYVGVRPWADFLALQATGGIKRPKRTALAIPTRIVRRTSSGRVPASLTPRALGGRKGFDPEEYRKRARIVVHRPGRLGIFFHLVHLARIRARWPLREDVMRSVRSTLPGHFERRARQALDTARR